LGNKTTAATQIKPRSCSGFSFFSDFLIQKNEIHSRQQHHFNTKTQ